MNEEGAKKIVSGEEGSKKIEVSSLDWRDIDYGEILKRDQARAEYIQSKVAEDRAKSKQSTEVPAKNSSSS
ncbi:unnamed protein product [Thlaspi arvense]|uniref:Uncharacterized protein n=1 Tax=Thlaspi arvense TaxID=13288 RepID=A0AAU9SPA9_THLAR|nr:unnamed protein product [Thlaspi arvense]